MSASKELFMQMREDDDNELVVNVNNLLNLNKSYIGDIVKGATASVVNGEYDAVKALVLAKKGQELFGQLEKAIRPIAEDKMILAKGETYKAFDTEIISGETGVKFDFTHCEDPEWDELKGCEELISSQLKERETFLKTVTKSITLVKEDSGEVYEIKPPVRSGKMGLKLSIK